MKKKSHFSWWLCVGVWGLMAILFQDNVRAQAYQSFPYESDFGTASAPGADNALMQFYDEGGSSDCWAFTTDNGRYCPVHTVSNMYSYSTLITRPFRFTAGTTYRLSVVYEASAAFDDAQAYWRLAPENPEVDFGYDVNLYPDNADYLIDLNQVGLPAGETSGTYEFSVSATGVYALTFTFCGRALGMFENGMGRTFALQSFTIEEKSPYDLAMGKIVTPYPHPDRTEQTVSAWVRNEGGAAVNSFKLMYTVGSQTQVEQTFTQNLQPGAEVLVSFDRKASLSQGANRIRVFLTDRPAGEPTGNDTSGQRIVTIYGEPYRVPFSFDFSDPTLNQHWYIAYDEHTDEETWRFGTKDFGDGIDRACAYIATTGQRNNARLVSPSIEMKAGQTYRFSFSYTGLSDKAEKLSAYMGGTDFMDESQLAGYWKDEGFSNTQQRTATFFYTAAADGEHHLVWKAHSDDISGGIAVWNLDVTLHEPTRGDFYYEVDPMDAEGTAAGLLATSAYFLDRNHNGPAWSLTANPTYNGDAAIQAGEAFGSVSDDWLVFNPIYLEAGRTYTLSAQARTGSSNKQVTVECLVGRTSFAFGESADIQSVHRETMSRTEYSPIKQTFTVPESGPYQMIFRYQADIVQDKNVKEEDYHLYLDHIGLYTEERHDFELTYVHVPVGAQMGHRDVFIHCGYRNFGADEPAADLQFCYQVGRMPVVVEKAVKAVLSGGIGQHHFNTTADFSQDTLNEVRVWVQRGNVCLTDTFKLTVHSLKSYVTPYRDLLTEESKVDWRISSLAIEPSWRFVTQETLEGPYAARTDASDGILDDYLVLPPMQLKKDSVYLVAFYAKANQPRQDAIHAGLSVVYSTSGYGVTNFDHQVGQVEEMSTEYKPYYFYFKSLEESTTFIALHSTLPSYSGYNLIDHVVVMDSVAASYSYMTMEEVNYRRVTGCDEVRTTAVEVSLRNDGFLAYEDVPVRYKMDDLPVQTFLLEGGLADCAATRFQLPEVWDLSVAGLHKLQVWVDMPWERDRKDDTITIEFRADDMAELPLAYDFENNVMPGNVEDLNGDKNTWTLRRNADSAYAGRYYVCYKGNGQPASDNWRLPCFVAKAGEYTLDFYMSAPYGSEEHIEISLLHYDEFEPDGERKSEILKDTIIRHRDYRQYQLPFKVEDGHYGVQFRIISEGDGRMLCIDNLTLAGYGLKDVAVLEILSPEEAEVYGNNHEVRVRLRNNGRVTVRDVPLILSVNDEEIQMVEVPVLQGQSELEYTFPQALDLSKPNTYRIRVYTNWVLDQRPGNNYAEVRRVQKEDMDLALVVMTAPMAGRKPYGQSEEVSVRIENRGRTKTKPVAITAIVNQTGYLYGTVPEMTPGASQVFTFEETVDMSASRWYEFLLFLSPENPDGNVRNDTLYSRFDGIYDTVMDNEAGLNRRVSLYPNPAREVLHVSLPAGFTHMEVYSSHGVRYDSRALDDVLQWTLPVADYPEGLYILRLTGPSGEIRVKWIKVR